MAELNLSKIKEIITRGVEDIIEKESLLEKLNSGKKLRIKHGIDPTGPRIHLGRAIQFHKLKAFQELDHQIVLIIGDFTAQIGDASDKDSMRKPLSEKEVKENMKDYKKQIGKILDLRKTEIRHNSQWLKKIKLKDFLRLTMKFTAQQLIQRRNFKERWEQGRPIGLHEMYYPLLQGYDSVMIKADIEIGGTDQLFNLKMGRILQEMFGQKPQDIITLKMLSGLDGRKMSTSWGNVINIIDSPKQIYGKIMSMKDEMIIEYFELCTSISLKEIKKIKNDLDNQRINPKDLKDRLAREIISIYYSQKEAEKAAQEFERVFKKNQLPEQMPEIEIKEETLPILDLLVKTKITSSKSEAKRLILQKGIKINGKVKENWQETIKIRKGMVVQVGKRKFVSIKK